MSYYSTNNDEKGIQSGIHNIFVNGEIIRGIPSKLCYVMTKSERTNFENEPAGTIVATYGLANMWQLKPDKTWAVICEEED